MRFIYTIMLGVLFLTGCGASDVVKYAEMEYPNCEVEYVGEKLGRVVVKVICPNAEPKFVKYKQR